MKMQWLSLMLQEKYGKRERYMIYLGTVAIVLLLGFTLIELPLTHHIEGLREQFLSNQDLLTWMQTADANITQLARQPRGTKPLPPASLLGRIQATLADSPLKKSVSRLQQTHTDRVEIELHAVNFDQLMAWLIQTWRTDGVRITTFSATADKTPGVVSAELGLSAG